MIPQKLLSLFEFIDYLDINKTEYIEKYIPICNELERLTAYRSELRPNINYIDKQKYDAIQNEINEKFSPILSNIFTPVNEKLKELSIWSGDQTYSSIWNINIASVSDFKTNFTSEDVPKVILYKKKYINFRKETNSNFLCLQLVFCELDEILKELFDFFKDTLENEFDSFEAKAIEVDNIADAIKSFLENKGRNVKFNISEKSLYNTTQEKPIQKYIPITINETVMGDKFSFRDINNNSGHITIGKDIRISDSLNDHKESFDKLEELIRIIRKEPNIDDEDKQALITNFDKVKEEISEQNPDKSKILRWLLKTKEILETLVLSHDVTETIQWVYKNLNFVIHQTGG